MNPGSGIGADPTNALKQVTLQLRWHHQFQFAGYYAAIAKGYYQEAGLEVTLQEGGPGKNTVEEVLNGSAQFGVTNSEILLHRLMGKPLVVLAAIFQHSPLVMVARLDKDISGPHDLVGKRVVLSRGSRDLELHATLHGEGIRLEDLEIVSESASPDDYFDKQIDAISAYITNQPYYLEEAYIPFSIIRPASYGIDFYGDCLFANEETISKNPELVKAFISASLKGWSYAMKNPDEIIRLILDQYETSKTRAHLRYEYEAMQKLIMPELIQLGHMNPGRWLHIAEIFKQYGMVESEINLDGFVYSPENKPLFSLKFVYGLLISTIFISAVAVSLLIFNNRLKREIVERKQVENALKASETQSAQYSKQLEQVSIATATLLTSRSDEDVFGEISEFVTNHLDYNRLVISVFQDKSPSRVIIGSSGVSEEILRKLTNIELSPSSFLSVFERAEPVGKLSYYVPHNLKCIPEIDESLEGSGPEPEGEDGWHPADYIIVKIINNAGEFIGFMSADESTTGKKPTIESVRPLEIFANMIAQVYLIKKEQEERAELTSKLQQAQKMETIGQLAARVSHDLNNILSGIVTLPDMVLMEMEAGSPHYNYLSLIQKSGKRAAAIVEDMLSLSRRGVTVSKVINIREIVDDYLKSPEYMKLLERHPSIAVHNSSSEGLAMIKGSPVHLTKVIMNLVQNSAEAMPDGGTITITTQNKYLHPAKEEEEEKREGAFVSLIIEDNGMGIAQEDISHIFEPFYTTKSMGHSGTGLGMTVVWGTIQDHQGYIDIDSAPNKGTRFEIFLPVTKEQNLEEEEESSFESLQGNGEAILVVDDVSEQRHIVKGILKKLNYNPASVTSGEEAIEYIRRQPVDVVILDVIMEPGIDGLEALLRIKQIKPEQKAIFASGYSDQSVIDKAFEEGLSSFIQKPYSLVALGQAIQNALKS